LPPVKLAQCPCLAVSFALLCTSTLLAQSADLPAKPRTCDDLDQLPAIAARDFLKAEAFEIVLFARLENVLRYDEGKCVSFQPTRSGFNLDFRGSGANLTFAFDARGQIASVTPNDAQQFVFSKEPLKYSKEWMIDEIKKEMDERGRNSLGDFSLDLFKEYLTGRSPAEDLATLLRVEQQMYHHPPAATFAIHNRYLADVPLQVVILSAQEAADIQSGARRDFTQDFRALDWHRPTVAANPGNTKLFPSGTRVTPILDSPEAALLRSSGGSQALDDSTLDAHVAKGVLTADVGIPYAGGKSGNWAALVELGDGTFGMIAGGALHSKSVLEADHPIKVLVPLTPQERMFKGTVDAFLTALPGFVQRAATAAGLDPHSYDKETAYLLDVVRTCGQITPVMVTSVTDRIGYPDFKKLGPKYGEYCVSIGSPSDRVKTWNKETERGIVYHLLSVGKSPWLDGHGFILWASFTQLASDNNRLLGADPFRTLFNDYGIFYATITPREPGTLTAVGISPPSGRAPDGFIFGSAATPPGEVFTGTADEFAAALPALIAKAAAAHGMSQRSYTAETAVIVSAARTCSQLTPHLAFTVSDDGGYGTERIRRLGDAYAICDGPPKEKFAGSPAAAANIAQRGILFTVSPRGRSWKEGLGVSLSLRFAELSSDPATAPSNLFGTYGIVQATIAQAEASCPAPPGGVPPDEVWREDGTQRLFRVHFDCDYADIYAVGNNDQIVADLALKREGKDKYVGTGLLSPCPGGKGKIEIRKWSDSRIDAKVQFPNTVTHQCGGLKDGYVLAASPFHTDMSDVAFVQPRPN